MQPMGWTVMHPLLTMQPGDTSRQYAVPRRCRRATTPSVRKALTRAMFQRASFFFAALPNEVAPSANPDRGRLRGDVYKVINTSVHAAHGKSDRAVC